MDRPSPCAHRRRCAWKLIPARPISGAKRTRSRALSGDARAVRCVDVDEDAPEWFHAAAPSPVGPTSGRSTPGLVRSESRHDVSALHSRTRDADPHPPHYRSGDVVWQSRRSTRLSLRHRRLPGRGNALRTAAFRSSVRIVHPDRMRKERRDEDDIPAAARGLRGRLVWIRSAGRWWSGPERSV
jgi:hypothetical protein